MDFMSCPIRDDKEKVRQLIQSKLRKRLIRFAGYDDSRPSKYIVLVQNSGTL